METNQFHRTEPTVPDSHVRRSLSASSATSTLAVIAACLLILLGVAFELGMLGFGPYNSTDVWVLSLIGKNGWVMLANLAVPQLREMAKIWPLMLVILGSAIFLISRHFNRFDPVASTSSVTKENNGNRN
jgi:hypothetical protein